MPLNLAAILLVTLCAFIESSSAADTRHDPMIVSQGVDARDAVSSPCHYGVVDILTGAVAAIPSLPLDRLQIDPVAGRSFGVEAV